MRKWVLAGALLLMALLAAGTTLGQGDADGILFEVSTTRFVREPAVQTSIMVIAGNMALDGQAMHLARVSLLTVQEKKLLTEQVPYHRLENVGKHATAAETRARLGLAGPVDPANRLTQEEFEILRPGLIGITLPLDLRTLGIVLAPGASLPFMVRAEFIGNGKPIVKETLCTIEYRPALPMVAGRPLDAQGTHSLAATASTWYWCAGDGHCHTAFSDGYFISVDSRVGAMSDYGFHWLLLTDHAQSMTSADFAKELGEAAAASTKYAQSASAGLEMSTRKGDNGNSNDSHYLAYNPASFVANPKPETRDGQGIINAVNASNSPNSFGNIAHPYNASYPWTYWAATGYTGMELVSGTEGNAKAQTLAKWDALLTAGVSSTLATGRFTAGVGNSDAHNFQYGEHMTFLLLPGTTPPLADVYNALRRGWAVVSTDGSFADFAVNGAGIGSTVSILNGSAININVRAISVDGSTYVRGIRIIGRNGQVLKSVSVSGSVTNYQATIPVYPGDPAYPAADGYFRVEVVFVYDGFWSDDTWYVYCNPVFFDLY